MKISVITPTHNPTWLAQTYESLKAQTHADWEWVVVPNNFDPDGPNLWEHITALHVNGDSRVRIVDAPAAVGRGIGAIKAFAFRQATGDVVLELDHDDLLAPNAIEECANTFADPDVDFAYSHCADFSDPPGRPITYHSDEARIAWEREGWRFGQCEVPAQLRDASLEALGLQEQLMFPVSFKPSAASFAIIMHAPNHFRAWRHRFYMDIGGHNVGLAVCDDHELMIRTYLTGNKLVLIDEVLYFYRITGRNSWLVNLQKIEQLTCELKNRHLHALVAKECVRRGLPCYDLGGAFDSPGKPWIPVDLNTNNPSHVSANLKVRWPFPDSSIGAFRAFDLLEHLPDKQHTMSEIYRCLAPGGWLLSSTPHALGDGAHQDPTHCSYWVENSFRYYTDRNLAKYIGNTQERFMVSRLFKTDDPIPYVVADLISLKDDDGHLPGTRGI